MNGRQPGGPDKATDAIIGTVESDAPPPRLVLGKYANDKVRKKLATAAKDKKTMSFIMPQKAVEKGVPCKYFPSLPAELIQYLTRL